MARSDRNCVPLPNPSNFTSNTTASRTLEHALSSPTCGSDVTLIWMPMRSTSLAAVPAGEDSLAITNARMKSQSEFMRHGAIVGCLVPSLGAPGRLVATRRSRGPIARSLRAGAAMPALSQRQRASPK